ncbi:MAG: DUF1669 domain-containing protein [Epsilonproteobacteria bacterium]|nr:nuclease NucT [Campylobacterota bacterium]NPA56809.1 DUF1669 domain-containing protein [Campylobacterota bacterium]
MKRLLLLSILVLQLFSGDLLFMPYESQQALKQLLRWIDQAHSTIDVAIYSFTNHTIAKRLKGAAKRGVHVRVIFDRDQALKSRYSQIGYLAKYRRIEVFTLEGKKLRTRDFMGKMHMKLAIIDGKRLVFGSANWSYSAFKRNYELIYFVEDYRLAKKALSAFNRMVREATPY